MSENEPVEKIGLSIDFNFSEKGASVLKLAATELDRLEGVTYIRPELLLAAVIAEGSSNHILIEHGVMPESVLASLRDLTKPVFKKVDPIGLDKRVLGAESRITNNTRDALFSARARARELDRKTEPEDIFYGITNSGHNYATDILEGLGFNWGKHKEQGDVFNNTQ